MGKNLIPTYKDYVIEEKQKDFIKECETNSTDFYSCGCVFTSHLVLRSLMQHTYDSIWKRPKITPKKAWIKAMEETNYHSGASAAMTAIMIAKYSPRGNEFKDWCIKNEVVMVDWK